MSAWSSSWRFSNNTPDEIRAGKVQLPGLPELEPAPGPEPYKGLQYFDVADAGQLLWPRAPDRRAGGLPAPQQPAGGGGRLGQRQVLAGARRAGARPCRAASPWPTARPPPDGSQRWPVHIITPTARPLESLAASLTRDSESVTATAILIDDLAQDPRSLHLYVRRLLSQPDPPATACCWLWTSSRSCSPCARTRPSARRSSTTCCAACPDADTACSPADTSTVVVLTLRADFYAQCAEFDNLREALERYQRYIGAMSQEELRRAIEEPARRGGWELEPGLVDVLLQDVGDEPGALPLLSHALLETWKRRRGRTADPGRLRGVGPGAGRHRQDRR